MFAAVKRSLSGLKRSPPGKRFQNKYHSAHRKGAEVSAGTRLLRLGLALVAFALGVVFAFIPGPAVVFFALAGALLAPESRRLAIMLDWIELKLRVGVRWTRRYWKSLDWFGRCLVILALTLVAIVFLALVVWFYFLS